MGKLEGKVALITGGTSGIGLAAAILFRDEGATVTVAGTTNIETWDERGIEAIGCDVTEIADIAALIATMNERHGRIDVLFANAGISGPSHSVATVDDATYELIMGVNFKGVYFTVQRALALMRDGGSIILTSSVAAHRGLGHASLYAASKAAVRSIGRSFAAELTPRGIRVNVVTPGPTETALMSTFEDAESVRAVMRERSPMKRLGDPAEIAAAVLFLASSASSYMTGAEISVTGGMNDI